MGEPPVQGYRLMIPGARMAPWVYATVIPYSWWEQIQVYRDFVECEREKMGLREAARDALRSGIVSIEQIPEEATPPRKPIKVDYRRFAWADCVPVR